MKSPIVRRTGIVTAAVAMVAASLVVVVDSTASAAEQRAPKPPKITWKTCTDPGLRQAKAECANVKVPLDHSKPSGKKITVAISRIKHTVPESKFQGVVLANPGGPGASGIGLARLGSDLPDGVGKAYDWIGFDPRGVGSSKPAVSCDKNYPAYNRPRYVPDTRRTENEWKAITRAYTARCDQLNGPILDHLTTRDVAKDLDLIRRGLGQKQINYVGFSYGTYLGQVYSTLYPNRARRLVFDGTVDPRGIWYQNNLNQDRAFDKNINIWFGWLAKHDKTYKLGKTAGAVRKLFYATQEKLYATPVTGPNGKLGGSEWNDAFLQAGYYQSTWVSFGRVFSDYVHKNDVDALDRRFRAANSVGDDNGYAAYLGVQCTDVTWPQRWSRWARDNWSIHAVAPFETWANAWYNEPCRSWPAKARKPVTIDGARVKSLLMINETLDAATPYEGSLEVRRRYPAARLVSVPGGTTHSGSFQNPCTLKAIADYLRDGTLPPRKPTDGADISCSAKPQPQP